MFRISYIFCFLYIIFALLWSSYQAYRGYMLQWRLCEENIRKKITKKTCRVIVLYIADAFTYFFTTMFGFISFYLIYQLSQQGSNFPNENGSGAIVIFLAICGILGITGKFPDLLNRFNKLS